jgi:hypothetical protein
MKYSTWKSITKNDLNKGIEQNILHTITETGLNKEIDH